MTIFEFEKAIEDALERAIDEETGEILDETAIAELNALQLGRDEKIDNVLTWYKDETARAAAIRAEEIALSERRKTHERKAEAVKRFVERTLKGEKFESARNKAAWRKSTTVEITDENALPEDYFRVKIAREPDKAAIKAAIKDGAEIAGVRLVENNNLSIK